MRQAVIVAPDRFEVVDAPAPALQGPCDILLRTAACGICSGDLMPWYLEKKVGTVLGHEVAGWAVEVGRDIVHVRPGDLVFAHHHAPCLSCPACERGDAVHCAAWKESRLDPGGMAEFIRAPGKISRGDCFAVNDLTPEQAVFIEPLGCCVKALHRLGRLVPPAGATGVVVGCGVMGLLNVLAARALGARRVLAVEPDPDRRRFALACGAAAALTPAEAGQELRHAADFVVVGPGCPDVIRQALGYVRPGGAASLFTPTPTGVTTALDLGELYFREVSLVPSYSCGPEETRLACTLLREQRVRVEALVTHRFRLGEVQQAYETARRGGPAVKVLVTFDRGGAS
ncbi:MAG TPA: alcohol dehydrogenase catalytic domain-containing protein [Gemmataceae bacterium]|nr:alcohol dehydrogenase catalytic domain-containing protein [Gemmataceae bacterium]